MSAQSRRIAVVLAGKDNSDIRSWLARLGTALAGEAALDRETIDDLVLRGRPRWGARSVEDGVAYIEFWADLVKRRPEPRLIAGYSDVLYLHGGPERECEALGVFLDAVRRDPSVFIEYSADFSEVPARCGPAAELEFELAKIAFYADSVDRNEMDVEELQEAVHELLARYGGDPSVRARLFEIAQSQWSMRAITR
jgi:hypothetical protein